ncbi:MAG: DUF6057 family protein [Bacteroidales bacterium]|nr:DUF6057 family protein [Bacteroidales bacterium]
MIRKAKNPGNTDIYYLFALFFIITFGYFFWFGDYVLFFQEKQSLLIFSREYLEEYFIKPGGLLELAGEFLTRFYINPANGALILSVILILPGTILFKTNRRLFSDQSYTLLFLMIPSILLLLMQTHYYHSMEYNLGYILVLLYFLITTVQNKKQSRYIALALFPFVYYLVGAYIWIFLVMFILYSLLYEKGKVRYVYPAVLMGIGGITLLVFKALLFFQPLDQLFQYPLPLVADPRHSIIFYLLTGYLVLYPLLGKTSLLLRLKKKYARAVSLVSVLIAFAITILILSKLYNPQTNRVLQLQKYVFEKQWNEAIELHETAPSRNLIGQYFYNIALSETDQLCDRLFFGRQDFGAKSLILPWGNKHLSRGAYFYYATGLINEAHRWAYEDMVVNGYRPQNLKLLVKTNLINGNYRMAEKQINMLEKSFNYRSWAKKYESLLYHPKRVQSHPELGEKIKLLPNEDFFIQLNNPQNNIPLLLNANQTNRKAFEYKVAWLMLNKNIEATVKQIKQMKELGYTEIPRHVEEAALAYSNSTGELPELGGLKISRERRQHFGKYVSSYSNVRKDPSLGEEYMRTQFGKTFWFYFHFK